MAELVQPASERTTERAWEGRSFADGPVADTDLEDLIHSWRRLGDPALRRLAIRLIRTLGDEPPGDERARG
jgi:hypothetical protein